MEGLMAIAIAAPAVAAIVGYLIQSGKEDEAQSIIQKAQSQYGGLNGPALEKATSDVLGPTNLAKIQADPAFRSAQMDTLAAMKQMSDSGGLTMADQANLNHISSQTQRDASGRDQQIQENMEARGVGGSGAELAMRLSSGQAAADRERQAGLDVAGQAQARAYQAMKDRGAFASQLSSDDLSQKDKVAAAQDAIDKFNLLNKQNVTEYNNQVSQQRYNNMLGLMDRQYGFAQEQAGYKNRQGQEQANVVQGIGGAIGQGAGTAAGYSGGSQYGAPAEDKTAGQFADYAASQTATTPYPRKDDEEYGYGY